MEITLPYHLPAEATGDTWLELFFRLNHPELWAPAGHEVAWAQFALPVRSPNRKVLVLRQMPTLTVEDAS